MYHTSQFYSFAALSSMSQTSRNTSLPCPCCRGTAAKPPSCCHPLELGCAAPSTHREKFAQLHQQQWQLNEVVLWLWALTSSRWAAKLPAREWERKVQVREWSSFEGWLWLFPETDLGHWLSFSPSAATSLQSFPGCQAQVTEASLFLTRGTLLNTEPDQEHILCTLKEEQAKYFSSTTWCSLLHKAQLLGLLSSPGVQDKSFFYFEN